MEFGHVENGKTELGRRGGSGVGDSREVKGEGARLVLLSTSEAPQLGIDGSAAHALDRRAERR